MKICALLCAFVDLCSSVALQNLKNLVCCWLVCGQRNSGLCHGEQSNAAERPAEIPFFNGMTALVVWDGGT